jgi:hypothetical protein
MINAKTIVIMAAAIAASRTAAAQETRGYISGGTTLSWQGSGSTCSSPHCATPGIGGTAIGVSGDIGGHIVPALSVAFEFSLPARFTALQDVHDRFASEVRIENHHRDIVLSGMVHVHASRTGRAQFAFVVGPSLVREDTLVREAERPFFPSGSAFGPYVVRPQQTRWTVGMGGGGDVAIAVNRRVSVVPQMRVHFISRVDPGIGGLGLSSFLFRPGVNVRVGF